ncbi:MAG: DNA translocase FtsK [Christensenellales bacterium]|jgi:hypothetical protein
MKKYKWAAILILVHAAIEILGGAAAFFAAQESAFQAFIVPYFNENVRLMAAMGFIYASVRILGAVGLLKNRMWGFALCVIGCVVTMALMVFMLPAGIVDGVLACTALVLLLWGYYGAQPVHTPAPEVETPVMQFTPSQIRRGIHFLQEQRNLMRRQRPRTPVAEKLELADSASREPYDDDSLDPLLYEAIKVSIDGGQATIAMLQELLLVDYDRAARLMDAMEQLGIVSEFDRGRPRKVLITREQFLRMILLAEKGKK